MPSYNPMGYKELRDFQIALNSGNGDAQGYFGSSLRTSLNTNITNTLNACSGSEVTNYVLPQNRTPAQSPILDIGDAVGALAGMSNTIGLLASAVQNAAYQWWQSIMDEMNSVPELSGDDPG